MILELVLLVICQTILADRQDKPFYDIDDHEAVSRHFEEFIVTHKKQYGREEKAKRFKIFKNSLEEINELNKKHRLAIFDVNKFAVMTETERKAYRGLSYPEPYMADCQVSGDLSTKDAPDSLDWRERGAVSPVKDQGPCGSCWAFSTTAMLESRYLQKNKSLTLSEQQVVDCDELSLGCWGGLMTFALSNLMKIGGLMAEADYPYEHFNTFCKFDKSKVVAQVTNCTGYSLSGEDALKEVLFKEGPLTIAVHADLWFFYAGGVFDYCDSAAFLDHGVLLIGYGTENGTDYWLIKNSWGTSWGREGGYIKVQRGVVCCSIGNGLPIATLSATVA